MRHKTAFDRLPRRVEALLERIELGRNVRANLRRLRHALESASPLLRERIQRALRAEIRRLRHGGITAAERSRIKRLRLVQEALKGTERADPAISGGSQAALDSTALGRHQAVGSAPPSLPQSQPSRAGGVLGTEAGRGAEPGNDAPFLPQAPGATGGWPFMLLGIIALGIGALCFAGVAIGVTERRNRSA